MQLLYTLTKSHLSELKEAHVYEKNVSHHMAKFDDAKAIDSYAEVTFNKVAAAMEMIEEVFGRENVLPGRAQYRLGGRP